MKNNITNRLQDTRQLIVYLRERLIVGTIIGIITLFLTIVLKEVYWEYAADLNTAILVALLIFMFYLAKDSSRVYELRNRLEKADLIYRDLIDGHSSLPPGYSKFMDERILESDFKNGIIMLNIDDERYRKWLEECSLKISDSYCVTFSHPYTVKNTLTQPTEDEKKKGKITPEATIKYLKNMNILSCKKGKKRIFVLDKNTFFRDINDSAILDDDIINFFKSQNSFTLHLIDKAELRNANENLYNKFSLALNSDFALFDGALAFRRIEDRELSYFFVNNGFETLPTTFRDFFNDESFKYCSSGFYTLKETTKLLKGKKSFTRDDLIKNIKTDLKIS